jgi:hypothetical protein
VNSGLTKSQELPHKELSHHEEAQPIRPYHDPGSERRRAHSIRAIRYVEMSAHAKDGVLIWRYTDFGKEKKLPLKGLDDKAIEQQVTELVQSNA